jgi:cell division protein FtsN
VTTWSGDVADSLLDETRHPVPGGRPRLRRQAGGTVLGVLIGLLVGLAVAVAAAVFMTRASVPFVNKVQRPADRPPEAVEGELPDPNRVLQRRPPGEAAPPAAAVPPAPSPEPAPPAGVADAPPAVPPAVAAPAVPAAGDKTAYLLQAGAFRGQEDAESMKVKLALIGFEARIVSAEVNGTTFYRVRVGPYAQLDDMNRARSRLAENGIEASVVRQR